MSVNKEYILAKKNIQIDGQMDFFDMLNNDLPSDEMMQFAECVDCWCANCKHNSQNEAIPRDFGGEKRSCPACDMCIQNDEPEICQIGSYKFGCKVRADEENISHEI